MDINSISWDSTLLKVQFSNEKVIAFDIFYSALDALTNRMSKMNILKRQARSKEECACLFD